MIRYNMCFNNIKVFFFNGHLFNAKNLWNIEFVQPYVLHNCIMYRYILYVCYDLWVMGVKLVKIHLRGNNTTFVKFNHDWFCLLALNFCSNGIGTCIISISFFVKTTTFYFQERDWVIFTCCIRIIVETFYLKTTVKLFIYVQSVKINLKLKSSYR